MNGGHDLGGMHGLGPVNPENETDEPVFHHPWERRVFALTLATGFLGRWNLDQLAEALDDAGILDYQATSKVISRDTWNGIYSMYQNLFWIKTTY